MGSWREREATVVFARSLVEDQDWVEELWLKRYFIEDIPLLLIWGLKDPAIKPGYLKKFHKGFPTVKTVEVQLQAIFLRRKNQPRQLIPLEIL